MSRGTLTRQMSFLTPKFRDRKKYKLIAMARISDFRLVCYLQRYEIFVVKIRNEESEYLFIAQSTPDSSFGDLFDFFQSLCTLV